MTEATEDISIRVAQYRAVRAKIAEIKERHEKELEPAKMVLEQLGGMLDAFLVKTGQTSAKTKEGTFFYGRRVTATVNDPHAFIQHVIDNQLWDMIERRANPKAVEGFTEKHKHLPPGVTLTILTPINVRAPAAKGALKEVEEVGDTKDV